MEVLQALSFACLLVILGAGIFAFFTLRAREQKKSAAAQQAHERYKQTLAELAEQVGSLRVALVEAGTIQRAAIPSPPPPPKSRPKPKTTPLRLVSVTKDSDPVHTRETREVPAADALVDATRPEPDSKEIRARYHKEADGKDARDKAAEPPLGDTLHSAVAPPEVRPPKATVDEDEDQRDTGEEKTKMWEAPKAETKRPPPHRPPRPIKKDGDPLAGVPLERPVPSAARTAQLGRRPTLFGGLQPPPREPTWDEKRSDQLVGQGIDPAMARQQAVEEGFVARAVASGAARPSTPTPTLPGVETIDTRIERRWHEKTEAAQQAGKDPNHCHGPTCLEHGRDVTLCECGCPSCRLSVSLFIQARREIRAEDEWNKP
jgi:hypothetical protein